MGDRHSTNRTWKTMKKWLRFKGLNCCGSPLNRKLAIISKKIDEAAAQAQNRVEAEESSKNEDESEPMIFNMGHALRAGGTNLAMLLAAERHLRQARPKKRKKPLMRLLEEMDDRISKATKWFKEEGVHGLFCKSRCS